MSYRSHTLRRALLLTLLTLVAGSAAFGLLGDVDQSSVIDSPDVQWTVESVIGLRTLSGSEAADGETLPAAPDR